MHYVNEILPSLVSGTGMTLSIFFWTIIVAIPLGILVGLGMTTRFKPLTWLINIYVWLMRGTPLLLQLIFVFTGYRSLGLFSSVMMRHYLLSS
ncbi:Amino acid ABC transporter, permease protein [Levilactobacillus brevis]|nr:Amino acid ABC transporter, permease protein [Levilactobacillus brevis]